MSESKLNAKVICEKLNKEIGNEDFMSAFVGQRIKVGIGAISECGIDINVSEVDGSYETSAFGFLQAFLDEPIYLRIDNGEYTSFVTDSEYKDFLSSIDGDGVDLNLAYRYLTASRESAKEFITNFDGVIVKARNPCDARLKYETESGLR